MRACALPGKGGPDWDSPSLSPLSPCIVTGLNGGVEILQRRNTSCRPQRVEQPRTRVLSRKNFSFEIIKKFFNGLWAFKMDKIKSYESSLRGEEVIKLAKPSSWKWKTRSIVSRPRKNGGVKVHHTKANHLRFLRFQFFQFFRSQLIYLQGIWCFTAYWFHLKLKCPCGPISPVSTLWSLHLSAVQ